MDRATTVVEGFITGRRAKERMRKRAAVLGDTKVPQYLVAGDAPPDAVERYTATMEAFAAAIGGDSTYMPSVVADGLKVGGLGHLASAVGMDDPIVEAEFGAHVADTADTMIKGWARLEFLTDYDIGSVRESLVLLAAFGLFVPLNGSGLEEFANATTAIEDADSLKGVIGSTVLSQLGMPDVLHDGLVRQLEMIIAEQP